MQKFSNYNYSKGLGPNIGTEEWAKKKEKLERA